MTERSVSPSVLRRIDAAIEATSIRRAELYLEMPECHKNKCQGYHPDGASALGLMERQIRDSIYSELGYETTTRPDLGVDEEPDSAVIVLAHLLSTYNVHDASTFVKAARLLIDAYPGIATAIAPALADAA